MEWSKGLCHKSLVFQTSGEMKPYDCAFWVSCNQVNFDIERSGKPLLGQDHTEFCNFSSEHLTKQDLYFSFLFSFFSLLVKGLLHRRIKMQPFWATAGQLTDHMLQSPWGGWLRLCKARIADWLLLSPTSFPFLSTRVTPSKCPIHWTA